MGPRGRTTLQLPRSDADDGYATRLVVLHNLSQPSLILGKRKLFAKMMYDGHCLAALKGLGISPFVGRSNSNFATQTPTFAGQVRVSAGQGHIGTYFGG